MSLVLMKICEPPELGCPVLAIESVPTVLEISAREIEKNPVTNWEKMGCAMRGGEGGGGSV